MLIAVNSSDKEQNGFCSSEIHLIIFSS